MTIRKSETRPSQTATGRSQPSIITARELEDLERASHVLGLSRNSFHHMIEDVRRDAEQAGHAPRWVVEEIKGRMKREYCTR